MKDEFITVSVTDQGTTTYSWEQIGTTTVDLSGYSTTQQMNTAISSAIATALADYTKAQTMTSTEINSAIATALLDYTTTSGMTTAINTAINTALADYSTTTQMTSCHQCGYRPCHRRLLHEDGDRRADCELHHRQREQPRQLLPEERDLHQGRSERAHRRHLAVPLSESLTAATMGIIFGSWRRPRRTSKTNISPSVDQRAAGPSWDGCRWQKAKAKAEGETGRSRSQTEGGRRKKPPKERWLRRFKDTYQEMLEDKNKEVGRIINRLIA